MEREAQTERPEVEAVGADRVREAFEAHPEAAILVFPRPADGRYPHEATDVVAVLDGAGLAVDYDTADDLDDVGRSA